MKRKPSRITPILTAMAKELGLEPGMDLHCLQNQWRKLIGPAVAAHSFPQAISHKTLTLQVDSAPWMQELSFLKRELLQKINQALGKSAIQSIRLRLASKPLAAQPERVSPEAKTRPLSPADRALLLQELNAVADPGLKAAIRKAMSQHMQKETSA